MQDQVYLDYNATYPILPEALEAVNECARSCFGNPSSVHWAGRKARKALYDSRATIAKTLGVDPGLVIFTGSATESNNLAIRGHFEAFADSHVYFLSKVEHPSIIEAAKNLKRRGADVYLVDVDTKGCLDIHQLKVLLDKHGRENALVSNMFVNNETGVIYPIRKISDIVHSHRMLLHTDAVQAFGKIAFNAKDLDVDYLSISSHKIGGPKGVGSLYVRNKSSLEPFILGGYQEFGLRSGTENVPGIVGFSRAAQITLQKMDQFIEHTSKIKARLLEGVMNLISGVCINGDSCASVPSTVNMAIDGVDGDALLIGLDLEGIAVSSGSACSSGKLDPSHVLLAMGLSRSLAKSSIRVSFTEKTTMNDVERFLKAFFSVVHRLRFSTTRCKA